MLNIKNGIPKTWAEIEAWELGEIVCLSFKRLVVGFSDNTRESRFLHDLSGQGLYELSALWGLYRIK